MSSSSFLRLRVLFAFALWVAPVSVSAGTVTVAATTADSVTLAWDPSDGATGYTVRWGTALGSYPNGADAGNNTTFTITGLTAGVTYWTVVQAYNSETVSGYSTPLQFTVAQSCTYSISPTGTSAAYSGTSGSISVTTQAGCAWSASTSSSFLTFQNGTGRTGSGTVTYSVAANTTTTARTATASVAGQTFTVSQAAAPVCTYSISPTTVSVSDAAATGSITVTTQTGCAWSASTSSNYLTFQNGTGRTGSGTVTFSVTANTSTTARTITGTVAGQTFTVSQAAAAPVCTYSISPTTVSVSDAAATGSITVTTQAGCAWSATSASSFLTFQNGTGRTGSGTVTFNVTANTSATARTGTASVAGQAFTVSQAAAAPVCTYSISPTTVSVSDAAATGSITVTTQAGCAWSATSASSFLTFQNGTGRTGSGTVTFNVTANTGTTARTGTATVAGQAFSVSQAAAPVCTYSINPTTISVTDAAASGTITVTTQAGCAWSATSASSFLTFQNGTGRTGSGSVTFSVTANTSTAARTGNATVAGQTFTVSQAAPPQACSYAITPSSASVPAAGTTGAITVTTQPGCAWSASSTSSFLTFPDGTGRTGSGTVSYVVAVNTGAFRSATATVAGKSFSIWQTASSCTYSISPASVSTSAAAATGTVTVTTQSGCAWSATSWSGFLTFQNGTGRTGPGSVGFTIAENLSTTRTASGSIAGVAFSVTQAAAASAAPPAGMPWTSDFNGDGKNDILVQDSMVGTVEAWFLDNATVKGRQTLSDTLDTNWMLGGRGDFNLDGKPDLVWQHKTDGRVSLWYMDGTTRTSVATPSIAQVADPQWKIVGVGDFNADGHPDLAWQHAGDGALAVWLMDGSTVTDTPNLTPDRTTDLLWKVVGVGDFNADGKSDLLWRHFGTGEMGAWLMNGVSRIIHSPLSPFSVPDQRWQVGAVIDANGDSKPDIVWHHTDGTIMIWHMNGTSRTTYPVVPTVLPVGWLIVGPK